MIIKYGLTKKAKYYITVFIACLFGLTTLISVGFGALNQNLNIASDVEYIKDSGNVIRSWTEGSEEDFHNYTYREKISSIEFLNNKNIPNDAVEYWDVSAVSNSNRVMAWIIDDPNNTGYYKLYLGADGKVKGNPDSSNMFNNFYSVEDLKFNNNFDTSEVINMSGMFANIFRIRNCVLDFSSFDTSNVTDMSGMFFLPGDYMGYLGVTFNLSSFDTSKVTNMSGMFGGCSVTSLNLSNFNTSKVTNMSGMFYSCFNLTNLDISSFNTSKVTDMSGMFGLTSLTNLNLSHFDTSQVTNMSFMFCLCDDLTSLNISNFDTSQVTDMSYMFRGIPFDNLNLSNFDTSRVTNMYYMFGESNNLIDLNLSGFNTSQVTNMGYMFEGCNNLSTIRITSLWNVSNVTNSTNMFRGCTNLPNFNSSYIDKSKAIPTTQGGYLYLNMVLGDYFTMVPDVSTYTISNSITNSFTYTIAPSELTLWRVININDDNTIEAISEYVSSNDISFSGSIGYARLIEGLQLLAEQYAKAGYTKSTRMFGYNGQTLTISNTSSFDGTNNTPPSTISTPSTGEEYGGGVLGDSLYLRDTKLVGDVYKSDTSTYSTSGLKAYKVDNHSTSESYWVANRHYKYVNNTNFQFRVYHINDGSFSSSAIRYYNGSWNNSNSGSAGIRPIITLKSNVHINGGVGTKTTPYTLTN